MEWLTETSDDKLDVLGFLDDVQPGPQHHAMAAAGRAGAALLTVNFDDLVEKALRAQDSTPLTVQPGTDPTTSPSPATPCPW